MKKNTYIKYRCSVEEKERIKKIALNSGYDNISDYLITISLNTIPRKEKMILFNEINNLRSKNAMVENNINQIAKFVNTNKDISDEKFNEYLFLFDKFINVRTEQNEKLNDILKHLYDS